MLFENQSAIGSYGISEGIRSPIADVWSTVAVVAQQGIQLNKALVTEACPGTNRAGRTLGLVYGNHLLGRRQHSVIPEGGSSASTIDRSATSSLSNVAIRASSASTSSARTGNGHHQGADNAEAAYF